MAAYCCRVAGLTFSIPRPTISRSRISRTGWRAWRAGNGQTLGEHAFSVAQHALLVEDIAASMHPDLTRRWRLAALLHDAPNT
jgi:5'-deoxynucleotidase YfbR-like HD superfamily hydrolase